MGKLRPIIETCQPRADIFADNPNPELFAPALGEVLRSYRGKPTRTPDIYTDSEKFFTDGTYPTRGLLSLFRNVLLRVVKGDGNAPAISRLVAGAGGGKTHGLIGIVHLVMSGTRLKHFASFIDPDFLPVPDTVKVLGLTGTELDLHKPSGGKGKAFTLWGEMALQSGGYRLYNGLGLDGTSLDAPAPRYFEQVLGNHPCVILVDELDQYAARLKIEYPGAEKQLQVFLLTLMEYAKNHSNIAVVLAYRGLEDARRKETSDLKKITKNVSGSTRDATGINRETSQPQEELSGIPGLNRQPITPVMPEELHKIMAKRLFENIDFIAAEEAAREYRNMYSDDPEISAQAAKSGFPETIEKLYPFHPGLVNLLTGKFGMLPTFRGARGLLGILSQTVRNIWNRKLEVPLIHTGHLDMSNGNIFCELPGEPDPVRFKEALDADVGSCASQAQNPRFSRAEQLDRENPHPLGYPVHQWTWKVVLLHSMLEAALNPGNFLPGIREPEAVLETAFPGLEPAFVRGALQAIEKRAIHLRKDTSSGKFFIPAKTSIDRMLTKAEKEIDDRAIFDFIAARCREIFGRISDFDVFTGVENPGDIEDKPAKPKLAFIDSKVQQLSLRAVYESAGKSPRIYKNLIFLVVPRTAEVEEERTAAAKNHPSLERKRLKAAARSYLACKKLLDSAGKSDTPGAPENISAIRRLCREKKDDLDGKILTLYNCVWYAGENHKLVKKKIRPAGSTQKEVIGETILRTLIKNGKLLNSEAATDPETVKQMAEIFFRSSEAISIRKIKESFRREKGWPVCLDDKVLGALVRTGIREGIWGIYEERMIGLIPDVYICTDGCEFPFPEDKKIPDDWFVIKSEAVKERGWLPVARMRRKTRSEMSLRAKSRTRRQWCTLVLENPYAVVKLLFRLDSYIKRGIKSRITRIELKNLKLKGNTNLNLSLENIDSGAIRQVSELFANLSTKVIVDHPSASSGQRSAEALLEIKSPPAGCILAESMKELGAIVKLPEGDTSAGRTMGKTIARRAEAASAA